jgi:hypothetical protein
MKLVVEEMKPKSAFFGGNGVRLGLLTVYILLVGTTMHQHAMWRDEMQAWLMARDSPNITALLHHLRYEGHPALWYLLLMPLTRISRDPVLMQGLQLVIAATSLGIVLWRAPLTWVERALFPFGYLVLYEYGVKSRSYALGFLLLLLFCALWRQRRQHPVLIAVVLALLANVHLQFMIVSISAACALLVDRMQQRDAPAAGWRANVAALILLLAGWMVAAWTIRPPPDPGITVPWYLSFRMDRLKICQDALGDLVSPAPSLWATLAGGALLLLVLARCKKAPAAAVFLLLSVAGMLALFYLKLPPSPWRCGILFLALFAANWIGRGGTGKNLIPPFIFAAVLAVQAFFGVQTVAADWAHPLSSGRAAARYIAAQGWAAQPIIGVPDYLMTPIIGYLGTDQFYFANALRWGSFTIWDQKRKQKIDMTAFLQTAARFGPRETLIAGVQTPINLALLRQYGFTQVAAFTDARAPEENYNIYRRGGN